MADQPQMKVTVGLRGPNGCVGDLITLSQGEYLDFHEDKVIVRGARDREVAGKILAIFPLENISFITTHDAFGDIKVPGTSPVPLDTATTD